MPKKTPPQMYPFELRPTYPHMLHGDATLWERFIRLNAPQSWPVAYDLHVGSLPDLPVDLPEFMIRDAEALYPSKIDVVIYTPRHTHVVEIKPRASITAIGQVLSYTLLFKRDFPDAPTPIPVIITDTAHQDTPWLCNMLGITLTELDHLEEQPK